MSTMVRHELAAQIFFSALERVNAYDLVKPHTAHIRSVYKKGGFTKLAVVAFGKASYSMAKALEDDMPDLLDTGLDTGIAITKYGNYLPHRKPQRVSIFEAGHPVPDENGLHGTERIITLVENSGEETLIVCLISGGGSALCVAPYDNIPLHDKQKITGMLLKAGAPIETLNTVRKHISRVKGGRLAELAHPATVISLVLSDVIGDKREVIASGPTAPDNTTYSDALNILDRYRLMSETPQTVLEVIYRGTAGLFPETPKEGSKIFNKTEYIIIGNNRTAAESVREKAEALGLATHILTLELSGEAREAGIFLADKALEARNSRGGRRAICLISGGETTVTVRGSGTGGRNTELALAFAMHIAGMEGITLLSAGTDGTDGVTDAAGAIVDGQTIPHARALGIDPEASLNNNDSYSLLKQTGNLLFTGPTETNVMDLQIVIIE